MNHFFGNQSTVELMQRYVHQIAMTKKIELPFLLRHGPSNIGKSTLAQELIGQLLGMMKTSDFLLLKDCSDVLLKKHTLKISTPKTDDIITFEDGSKYEDIGVREMNERLVKSSLSGLKVVLLENIERLTPEAANALLKNLEEPLPGRLIIATTSNKHKVLETILSRATLVTFQDLTEQESRQALNFFMPLGEEITKKAILAYTMGRPGLISKITQQIGQEEQEYLIFEELIQSLNKPGRMVHATKIFQKCIAQGIVDHMLKVLIQYYTMLGNYQNVASCIQALQKTSTNVKVDQILFELVLKRQD